MTGFRSDPPKLVNQQPVRGLGTADFDVVYQPIVDLKSGRFFAHEALVRCKAEALKSPLVLFEEAVKERACGRLGRTIREVSFARCPGVPLFVNIHPDELGARWLVRPDDPVFFHDNSVYLEITESAAFTHFDLCAGVLREVCSRSGAHLVVDDLGAGYSNLKRIIDLEPKVVKLDRSLVAGLDRRPRQRVLFTSVVKLCADLGARVVAEGIETIDEFKAARDCGAHYGQGYLLARPGYPPPAVTFPSV
jgi:EAL domain-containing protein (putative c-di-GMP-specific phosphodiesterase class I)